MSHIIILRVVQWAKNTKNLENHKIKITNLSLESHDLKKFGKEPNSMMGVRSKLEKEERGERGKEQEEGSKR